MRIENRLLVVSAIAAASCTQTDAAPAPAPRRAPAADAQPAAIASRDASSIDACRGDGPMPSARSDYPVPSAAELAAEPANSGWFFDGKGWQHILAACDLRDRVVMLDDKTEGPSGGSMWIWSRRDGSARRFAVDETLGHTGHSTSTAKSAPAEDRVVDFIRDATMFHGRVGPTYPTMVDCRTGGEQSVEYLVACSTKQHFAEIDSPMPPACTTFPDGIGWPLSITLTDARDTRTTMLGSLATISADRTTWTYRFASGVELELRVGPSHGGVLRFASKVAEPCVMIFSDHRRVPVP